MLFFFPILERFVTFSDLDWLIALVGPEKGFVII